MSDTTNVQQASRTKLWMWPELLIGRTIQSVGQYPDQINLHFEDGGYVVLEQGATHLQEDFGDGRGPVQIGPDMKFWDIADHETPPDILKRAEDARAERGRRNARAAADAIRAPVISTGEDLRRRMMTSGDIDEARDAMYRRHGIID